MYCLYMKKNLLPVCFFILFCCSNSYGYDITVAKDGSGNYTTLQAAIDAAPAGRTTAFTIYIKNGTYKEKITIPSSKPYIQLIGESVANTIITYDDYAALSTSCGTTLGTQNSASFSINATDFAAVNITFQNSYGDGSQAVAVLVNADRAVFANCRFLGNQDTLYLKGGGAPRCYFKKCYIDGNIDFIFGNSVALFDSCVLYAKTRPGTSASYITAPNTPTGQTYGFVFRDARLPANNGETQYYLSRPWPSPSEALTAQNVVFINANMSGHIQPTGWSTWNASTITANLYYAEYNSRFFSGAPVDISNRVPWSYQLTATQADAYTVQHMFGAWDPCTVQTGICNNTASDIAVSNFKIVKGNASSVASWNISWPLTGIRYALFRSDNNSNFTEIYNSTVTNDTTVNFQYTDASVPAAGSSYWYYLVASKDGLASHISDTVLVSNTSNLQVNAPASLSLCGLIQTLGTPSPSQTYSISGTNLTGTVDIVPPANFEVSADGSQWYNSAEVLALTPSGGSLPLTTIYVRLNAAATGIYAGNISNTTAGDTPEIVPVKGRTVPAVTSEVLQRWPLVAGTSDDPAVRNSVIQESAPAFNNLFVTDGTLPTPAGTIPAYSQQYGQVFGANETGNNWQNVGGTLKRHYYQEFMLIKQPGSTVRADSISFYCDFYGTQSQTKMAAVYSRNGFRSPADSSEFSDGVGPSGSALLLGTSGTFSRAFPLLQNNNGPVNYYSLALNGNTGVELTGTDTLRIRLYWACSSTGTPRYAMLKNVTVKGVAGSVLPLHLVYFTAVHFENKIRLGFATQNEMNMQGFEVERSLDGTSFWRIGYVAPFNTSGQHTYDFYDQSGISGTVWYRLKMMNRDGSFVYSNINVVNVNRSSGLKIVPNLVTDNINVFHKKAKSGDRIEIYAADGRKMLQQQVVTGAAQSWVNAATLPSGLYHLVFVNEGHAEFVKFIRQ